MEVEKNHLLEGNGCTDFFGGGGVVCFEDSIQNMDSTL